MEILSIILFVLFSRFIGTFITGFVIGKIFDPTSREFWQVASIGLVYIFFAFLNNLITGNPDLIARGIAGLLLWAEFALSIRMGKYTNTVNWRRFLPNRFHVTKEQKRDRFG